MFVEGTNASTEAEGGFGRLNPPTIRMAEKYNCFDISKTIKLLSTIVFNLLTAVRSACVAAAALRLSLLTVGQQEAEQGGQPRRLVPPGVELAAGRGPAQRCTAVSAMGRAADGTQSSVQQTA